MIRAVSDEAQNNVEPARIARRFHSTLAEIVSSVCGHCVSRAESMRLC